MSPSENSLKKMALLSGAKLFGIMFSFLIPMYLGRTLDVIEYGTYKQLMLFFWFAQVGLNFGLDDYTYKMIRQDKRKFSLYSLNSLCFNFLLTSLLWLVIVFFRVEIGNVLNNNQLPQYLPMLGFLILATVCSAQYGGVLIGLDQYKKRFALDIAMEFFKSSSIFVAFYFFHSIHYVLLFLSLIMGTKLAMTLTLIVRNNKKENLKVADALESLKEQISFGIPLGISRIIQNLLNMENFLISSMLGMVQFTFYTVGSFENPLINAGKSGMFEVVNIEMADSAGKNQLIKEAWLRLVRKIYLLFVPFTIYMIFFANEIITFVFSSKYAASVPVFMLFNVYVLLSLLNPEPIFRITSETKSAFLIRTLGSVLGVGFIFLGAHLGGMNGAMLGKIAAILFINATGIYVAAKLIDSSLTELLMIDEFCKILTVGFCVTIAVRLLFYNSPLNVFFILAMSFSLFFTMTTAALVYFGVIRKEEVFAVRSFIQLKLSRPLFLSR